MMSTSIFGIPLSKLRRLHLSLLFLAFAPHAKTQALALETGYKYYEGGNFQIGISNRFSPSAENPLNAQLSLLTNFAEKHLIVVGLQKRIHKDFEVGFNISNRYVEPTAGVNFINFMKLNVGYAIPYNQKKASVTFGVTFCIGKTPYYDYVKMGW